MSNTQEYIHGYTPLEQQRLIEQAKYWSEGLILPDLPYQSGETLLDIGCGAGAVLGEVGLAHAGLNLLGVDFSSEQIDVAKEHLKGLGLNADLQVADALALPFEDNSIDHVYMMWFLEHLNQPVAALREALRVLKPGGTITANETDYSTLIFAPETVNSRQLMTAFCEVFDQTGHTVTGPKVEAWMAEAGFSRTQVKKIEWHFGGLNNLDNSSGISADNSFQVCEDLNRHAEYMLGFIEPSLKDMGTLDGINEADIAQGIADVRKAGGMAEGKIGLSVWRNRAFKKLVT